MRPHCQALRTGCRIRSTQCRIGTVTQPTTLPAQGIGEFPKGLTRAQFSELREFRDRTARHTERCGTGIDRLVIVSDTPKISRDHIDNMCIGNKDVIPSRRPSVRAAHRDEIENRTHFEAFHRGTPTGGEEHLHDLVLGHVTHHEQNDVGDIPGRNPIHTAIDSPPTRHAGGDGIRRTRAAQMGECHSGDGCARPERFTPLRGPRARSARRLQGAERGGVLRPAEPGVAVRAGDQFGQLTLGRR